MVCLSAIKEAVYNLVLSIMKIWLERQNFLLYSIIAYFIHNIMKIIHSKIPLTSYHILHINNCNYT